MCNNCGRPSVVYSSLLQKSLCDVHLRAEIEKYQVEHNCKLKDAQLAVSPLLNPFYHHAKYDE